MTDTDSKIRELGQLAVQQLESLERLDPHNANLLRQFEENSARSLTLIAELTASLNLQSEDSYDFFCEIIAYCAQNNSDAAALLKTCMKQIGTLHNRT